MARVVQGGEIPGRQLVGGRWQHPNATPQVEDKRWSQDKRWRHVAGGGPKVDTAALKVAAEAKAAERVKHKREDLLPRDKKKHYGINAGRRNMRRYQRKDKGVASSE